MHYLLVFSCSLQGCNNPAYNHNSTHTAQVYGAPSPPSYLLYRLHEFVLTNKLLVHQSVSLFTHRGILSCGKYH